MPVSDTHREYNKHLQCWELVRDCVEGSAAIKSRAGGSGDTKLLSGLKGSRYLPIPNANDNSEENRQRYIDYVTRANYVNFTGSTKDGMLGMVFRQDMEIDLPESVAYLEDNANGDGLSLQQLTQDIIGDALETGRYGLLVDYPPASKSLTKAEVQALNLRASIKQYTAENILNWRTSDIGGVIMLTLLVLKEPTEKVKDDGFGVDIVDYYRVLFLKDGIYKQNLYDEDQNLIYHSMDDEGKPMADIIPTKSDGSTWDVIPFCFVGAQNNDSTVDKAPLYDIANVNIAHYRNSADFEESSYMVGQPTPAIAGLTQGWVDTNMKEGVFLGSRRAVLLPEGGSLTLAQANENQMPSKGMADKEMQLIKLGARIIQDSSGNETAEAAKIRFAGQNSKLGMIVANTESALIEAIKYVGEFMGNMGEFVIKINRQFYDKTIDPQLITAQIMLLDRGVIGKPEIRADLRKGGIIDADRTDEEIDNEAEEVSPIE